jgi:hypothetical protein
MRRSSSDRGPERKRVGTRTIPSIEPEADADRSPVGTPEALELYRACCESIRIRDDISIKLMAAVPVVTGVGIALLVPSKEYGDALSRPWVGVGLSLFGLLVTVALFLWERRNIQQCIWFAECARALEQGPLGSGKVMARPPHHQIPSPTICGHHFGKEQSEYLLYSTMIFAWICLIAYKLFEVVTGV